MSNDVHKRINEEIAASEANPDAPISETAKVSRPNRSRSTVYSIRLNAEEVASLQALAEQAGLPSSTLVRSWIIDRLRSAGSHSSELQSTSVSVATGLVDRAALQRRGRSRQLAP